MTAKKSKWQKIGVIGVDAGLCWVGDPCYILKDKDEERYKELGQNWPDFCHKIGIAVHKQFNYDAGHAGLGVCGSTGYGDGVYDVMAKFNEEGRVAEIKVVFI